MRLGGALGPCHQTLEFIHSRQRRKDEIDVESGDGERDRSGAWCTVLSSSPIRGNLQQTQALMHDWLAAQASQMMQGIEGQNPFFLKKKLKNRILSTTIRRQQIVKTTGRLVRNSRSMHRAGVVTEQGARDDAPCIFDRPPRPWHARSFRVRTYSVEDSDEWSQQLINLR